MKKSIILSISPMIRGLYVLLIVAALAVTTINLTAEKAAAASPFQGVLDAINANGAKMDLIQDFLSGLQLSIIVNEGFCGEDAFVQCSGSGHTLEAAASDNHNPVHIAVLVTRLDGSPVDGIPSGNFLFEASIGPGPGIYRCEDPQDEVGCGSFGASFIAAGGGLYSFVVHPNIAGFDWKVAKYGFTLTVTDNDGHVGKVLDEIVIDH